jgi:hypothetical protein
MVVTYSLETEPNSDVFHRSSQWDVRAFTDYRINPRVAEVTEEPGVRFFVQVNATGQTCEGFRFPLDGGQMTVDVWAKDIFEAVELRPYRLRYQVAASYVELRPNALTSRWEDVEELLARGLLVAYHEGRREDVTPEVRKLIHNLALVTPETGASLRWGLQAGEGGQPSLVLQGLPRPSALLRRDARLTADFAGGVELHRSLLEARESGSAAIAGLYSVLFSRDPERTLACLSDDSAPLLKGEFGWFYPSSN